MSFSRIHTNNPIHNPTKNHLNDLCCADAAVDLMIEPCLGKWLHCDITLVSGRGYVLTGKF